MRTLNVTRKDRSSFVLPLPAGVKFDHPECAGSTFEMNQRVELEDGTPGIKTYRREQPGSLTWMPGETKTGLPVALREVEQFKREQFAGRLVVVEVEASPTPPPADEEPVITIDHDDKG